MGARKKHSVVENFLNGLDFSMLNPGRSDIIDAELESEEKVPEPTKASKEFYTWLALILMNFRSTEIEVQEGGIIKRKYITEVDDLADIGRAMVDMTEKKFLGKRISIEKAFSKLPNHLGDDK